MEIASFDRKGTLDYRELESNPNSDGVLCKFRVIIIGFVVANGALQPLEGEWLFNGKTKEELSSRLNGLFNKNLNMNGEFIVVRLDNGLIEVSLMPTNRQRMKLQTRDVSFPLID